MDPQLAIVIAQFVEKAAGALGEAIGKELAQAIFGDEKNEELTDALGRIESQIREIVLYLNTQLPQVIRQETTAALLDQEVRALKAAYGTVQTLINTYGPALKAGTLGKDKAQGLIDAGNKCFEYGQQLLEQGQEWYFAGIHGFTAGAEAYVLAIKLDGDYAGLLPERAKAFSQLVAPWLQHDSPNGTSFVDISSSLQRTLQDGTQAVSEMRGKGNQHFLLSWIYEPANTLRVGFCTFAMNEDLSLIGNPLRTSAYEFPDGHQSNVTVDLPAQFSSLATPRNWWAPPNERPSQRALNMFHAKLRSITDATVTHPPRIAVIQSAVHTIREFQKWIDVLNPAESVKFEDIEATLAGAPGK